MAHSTRLPLGLLLSAVIAIMVIPAAPAQAANEPAGVNTAEPRTDREDKLLEHWANRVWDAARHGDEVLLNRRFDEVPADLLGEEPVARFRTSRDQLRANQEKAAISREEARQEALAEMRAERAADNHSKALRKAVTAQTLSEDLNLALRDAEIMDLVNWAEERVPVVEKNRDWLDAQELLYLLRTFYEDTERRLTFQSYNEHLERVNRRVGLLARYAPRQLHDMRNARAERLGEESFGDFNPNTSVDWRERIEDIDHSMVKQALGTAAAEHIESKGWRPLLDGGLEELQLLATTSSLSSTFPTLAESEKVERWTKFIDQERRRLAAVDDLDLSRWNLIDLLDDLKVLNDRTLELPMQVLLREFGDGATNNLDTYSEIIWPAKLRRFQQATAGNFVGVGILIRHNDKREIEVVNPLEGTPAYFAGVKPNDLIMEVDGNATVGWSLNDAVDRITGKRGTEVTIGLKRESEKDLIQVPIERDIIKIRSVKGWYKRDLDANGEPIWDWYVDRANRIAYIRLTQFTEDSYEDLRRAWREINADGRPGGLIFDLRHNPGGLLTSAVQISNLFVPSGSIVTGEDKDGNRAWSQEARGNFAEFAGVPTTVLTNRGSASASEIVAGCLQAHGAAMIVGERTFGKGSVQTIHHVAPAGRMKLTTQYYRLPSPDGGETAGRLVHKRPGAEVWGVDPDMTVPMSVTQVAESITLRQGAEIIPLDDNGVLDPKAEDRPDVNTLLTDGIDPQLATALLILQAQALAHVDVRHAAREARIGG